MPLSGLWPPRFMKRGNCFKNMMLIEGLKPSLDEKEQILLLRKSNVAWQNNKKTNITQ